MKEEEEEEEDDIGKHSALNNVKRLSARERKGAWEFPMIDTGVGTLILVLVLARSDNAFTRLHSSFTIHFYSFLMYHTSTPIFPPLCQRIPFAFKLP